MRSDCGGRGLSALLLQRADSVPRGPERSDMIFRLLFDAESASYACLLGDEGARRAVLIDAVLEQGRP